MASSLIHSTVVPCRSLLIDIKGTRRAMLGPPEEMHKRVELLNIFYDICESYFSWRFRKYGDFQCLTFSDSCYTEVYCEPPSDSELVKDACELAERLTLKNMLPRLYLSKGYSARRDLSLVRTASGIFHSFGAGDAITKVFDAEGSHFEGIVFAESSMVHTTAENEWSSLGKLRTVFESGEFVRII